MRPAGRPHPVASAVALALPLALLATAFHVVPTARGEFRGITDPPDLLRWVLAGGVALLALLALARWPSRARAPILVLWLALLPLLSVLTGRFPGLLAFQGPVLVLLVLMAAAVALRRLVPERAFQPRR